jgi:hypothetical protein
MDSRFRKNDDGGGSNCAGTITDNIVIMAVILAKARIHHDHRFLKAVGEVSQWPSRFFKESPFSRDLNQRGRDGSGRLYASHNISYTTHEGVFGLYSA